MSARPANVGDLARELARQERIRDGYLELAAEGITPREELRGKLRTVEAELERLRAALNAAASYRQDTEELEAHLQKTRQMIEHASAQWLNSRAKPTGPRCTDASSCAWR
jgi:chromosome segregation ATPase